MAADRQARARALGCAGAGAAGARGAPRRAGRAEAAGARGALGSRTGCRRAACAHLGMLAGLWAMHLVHSACFDPVSTQYCS